MFRAFSGAVFWNYKQTLSSCIRIEEALQLTKLQAAALHAGFRTIAWHGRTRASAFPELSGMEASQEMRQLLSGPVSFTSATPDLPVSCPTPAGHIRSWWCADAERNEDTGLHLVPDDFIKVISNVSRASSSISRLNFARTVYFN